MASRRFWDHYRRFFFEEEEDLDDIEGRIFLNPPRVTYYLGRGRRGDNSRLHRGIMIIRERERDGFDPIRLGRSGRRGRSGDIGRDIGRSGRRGRTGDIGRSGRRGRTGEIGRSD